jgi:hypothetical protein
LPAVVESAILYEVDLLMTVLTDHVLSVPSVCEAADTRNSRLMDSEMDRDVYHST